ncbi:MAG: PEGA domain-containing protein [Deltaproteobacteria bacterium]|nr:PEGA domain-containing protein [Deltaproteobacteria bacterium]
MRQFFIGGLILGVCLLLRISLVEPVLAASTGSIAGRVVLVGEAPKPKKIEIKKDTEKCGTEKLAEDLVVSGDRGIKNAVISLPGIKGNPAKAEKNATLDQKGCVFSPHVLIVPTGTPVDILNNEGLIHNFHTHSTKNPIVNKAQPPFKKKMTETFNQPEVFKITCDFHPWMQGWVVVTDSPYVVATDGGGTFKLTEVPAGTHTIEVWHETLGKVTKQVTVKAGEEAKVTFELTKK